VHAVAISPDGTWLATAGRDGTVRIWDTATGTQQATLTGHAKEVTAVAISPDGTWLATASWDETVWIWDTATGTQQATLTRHTDRVTAVSISPDGTWLASASYDRTVRIWHASSYEPVASMRVDADMRCCAWLPDDAAVAVGGSAGLYLFSFSPASVTGRVEGFADVSAQREQTATRRSLSP
jgi:WD40 repeat protein